MHPNTVLYYESHITIEPVFGDHRAVVQNIVSQFGFKLADLLMKKREEDTEERSDKDTFMTAHGYNYDELLKRMSDSISALKAYGYKVWRYKIEIICLDSRNEDTLLLIS